MNWLTQRVRQKATEIELHAIECLDMYRNPGASGNQIKYIQLTFIDNVRFTLTVPEYRQLSDVTFMLRPIKNDS